MKCNNLNSGILILITFLSMSTAQLLFNEDNKCEKISSLLINHIITHNPLPEKYAGVYKLLKYSGTGLNDLGDYYACNSLPYAHFYTISVSMGQLGQSIGICYLKECDKAYVENALMHLYDYIDSKVKIPIQKKDIKVNAPIQELKERKSKYLVGLIIILLLLLIEVILMFLGSMTNYKLLSPFNIVKNSSVIFNVRNPNQTYAHLRVFDGIRFLSCGWVVFGHVAASPLGNGRNIMDISYLMTSWYTPFITAAFYSVDVFFFMSGFLFYFSFQKFFNQTLSKLKMFFFLLLARYCRLLPFMIFAIFGMTYILPYLSEGPNYWKVERSTMGCQTYWWHNLLYINNFTKYKLDESGCMGHGWYLACDMQFFLYSLVVAVFFNNYKSIQHIIYTLTFVFSIEWQYVQVYVHHYPFNDNIHREQNTTGNFFNDFYIHPIARIGPYLLGIFFCELFLHTDLYIKDYEKEDESAKTIKPQENSLDINTISISRLSNSNTTDNINLSSNNTNETGIALTSEQKTMAVPLRKQSILYKINKNIQNSALASWIIFVLSLICINVPFWVSDIGNRHILSVFWSATLNTWGKIVFILGLGLIIHLTFLEKFNFIRHFLTLKIGSVISKSTYGIYIIHIYLGSAFVLAYNNFYYIRIYDLFLLSVGIFCVTWVLALVIGLLIESPIIVICKLYIKGEESFLEKKKESKAEAPTLNKKQTQQ